MKNLDLFVACHLMLSLAACSSTGVTYYADQLPELVLEDFFDGNLEAYGVVKDWRGRVIRKFEADIIAYWDRDVCTLVEDFIFDDGVIDRRVWTRNPLDQGRYSGIADDVVGEGEGDVAVEGNSAFFVFRITRVF